MPEIRLASQPSMDIEKESTCVLSITNPTDFVIRVRITPIDCEHSSKEENIGDLADEINTNVSFGHHMCAI